MSDASPPDEFELDDEEIAAALEAPSDPGRQVNGDGGNLELWDDEEYARRLTEQHKRLRRERSGAGPS